MSAGFSNLMMTVIEGFDGNALCFTSGFDRHPAMSAYVDKLLPTRLICLHIEFNDFSSHNYAPLICYYPALLSFMSALECSIDSWSHSLTDLHVNERCG